VSRWLETLLLIGLGLAAWLRYGCATTINATTLRPGLALKDLVFWSTITFALTGLEAASFMGGEIQNPSRNIPRGILMAVWTVVMPVTVMATLAFTPLPARSDGALSPAAQRGLVILRTHCARCHAIDKISASPLKIAPPFRILHLRYPIEDLEEPLAEGVITGHPTMPEFQFDPGQVGDIIAYLKALER
jgi:cytochrome c